MSRDFTPRNCRRRTITCHSCCKDYIAFRAEKNETLKKRDQAQSIESYFIAKGSERKQKGLYK